MQTQTAALTRFLRFRRFRRYPGPLRALLLSELCTLLAHAMGQTCIAWWIAQAGGGADLARYGGLLACSALLALPLLSPLGDRWPKARLIRLGSLCLLLEALALLLLAGGIGYRLTVLCACSALAVVAQALLQPAQASILPELVDAGQLPEALRLRRGAQALGGLLGPGLAGLALGLGGVAPALGLNLAMVALAAVFAWGLKPSAGLRQQRASGGWWQELAAGLRAKWGVPLDRWWSLSGALMMVFLLPATGMLLPLRLQALGLGAACFGACSAALSLGVLAGVAGMAGRLIAWLDRVHAIACALLTLSLAVAALGACERPVGLVLLFALVGLCMSVTQLVGQTHRLLAMPEDFRARMSAAQLSLSQLAALLAPALAGLLLGRYAVATVYGLLAAGLLASSLLLLAIPGLPAFLRLDHEQVRNWYGRQHPEAFARRP